MTHAAGLAVVDGGVAVRDVGAFDVDVDGYKRLSCY